MLREETYLVVLEEYEKFAILQIVCNGDPFVLFVRLCGKYFNLFRFRRKESGAEVL